MAPRELPVRVEMLEKVMSKHAGLPIRVDRLESRSDAFTLQFLQFRDETRDAFSALRSEINELREGPHRLATWSEMKLLHEDLVERIKRLGEGRSSGEFAPPGPRRRSKR